MGLWRNLANVLCSICLSTTVRAAFSPPNQLQYLDKVPESLPRCWSVLVARRGVGQGIAGFAAVYIRRTHLYAVLIKFFCCSETTTVLAESNGNRCFRGIEGRLVEAYATSFRSFLSHEKKKTGVHANASK